MLTPSENHVVPCLLYIALHKQPVGQVYSKGVHRSASATQQRVRVLLGLPRFCSASGMFSETGWMWKRCASLLCKVRASLNRILALIAAKLDSNYMNRCCRIHIKTKFYLFLYNFLHSLYFIVLLYYAIVFICLFQKNMIRIQFDFYIYTLKCINLYLILLFLLFYYFVINVIICMGLGILIIKIFYNYL